MVIVAVALLLLGPDKLPEVAQKLGASWRALKRIQERVEAEVREAIPDLPSTGDIARIARSPVNLLNELADRVISREDDAPTSNVASTQEIGPITPEPEIIVPFDTARPNSYPTVRTDSSPSPIDPSLN